MVSGWDTFLHMGVNVPLPDTELPALFPLCIPGMLLLGSLPQAEDQKGFLWENVTRPRGKTQRHCTEVSPKHHLARWPSSWSSVDKIPHPLHTLMLRASNWLYNQRLPDSWGSPLTGMMEPKLNKEENLWGKKDCANRKKKKLIKSLISRMM